jgi:nucleoside-diphosphate-sugar epimerase
MTETWADISAATERLGYQPCTGLREGLQQTVDWLTAPDIA